MMVRRSPAGLGLSLAGLSAIVWAVAASLCLEAADARGKTDGVKPPAAQPLEVAPSAAAAPSKAAVNANGKENGKENDDDDIVEAMGSNAACCVCHMTFLKESMAKSHLKAKVGCAKCHGVSANHANDEHIGATKPDIVYRRDRVDASCKKCHEQHNASAKDVIGRFVERNLPTSPSPTCTECHGMHRIDRAVDAKAKP